MTFIVALWAILQVGGLFTPGLLDDVDSVYIQIAREMLQRHDYVTPTIDGIRFFDKPPLMYWMAAGSMQAFGVADWAARLPLAVGVLGLLLAVYALGIRLYRAFSPDTNPDRAGLYAAVAMATSIGPYLYTRFYIPDILVALWLTLAVYFFLIAVERVHEEQSPLLPSIGFGVVVALNVLTKGLIGLAFPIGVALLYIIFSRDFRLLLKLRIPTAIASFVLVAAPWHILAALRNPPIDMPAGLGLPPKAGWAWFYLYNEHVARFLGKRIPHDYGQVPIPLFWLLLVLWLVPWAAFLPGAIINAVRRLWSKTSVRFDSDVTVGTSTASALYATDRLREGSLSLLIWAGLVLGFFTASSRQEYYHLPALPALALLAGALLAAADRHVQQPDLYGATENKIQPERQALRGSMFLLVPLGSLLFVICGYLAITSPAPPDGFDLNTVLNSNPDLYNLSLGHMFDLTGQAMGFFRLPLAVVAICMLVLGPGSHLLRRQGKTFAANIVVALSMTGVLLAAHEGLVRFYPILGSKQLAQSIDAVAKPGELVLIDGELTSGSTLLFYTSQPVLLINGRVNGPWFGSFWPDAPHIFADDAQLRSLWSGQQRIFLLTYNPKKRTADLAPYGSVFDFGDAGGKTVLTNRR